VEHIQVLVNEVASIYFQVFKQVKSRSTASKLDYRELQNKLRTKGVAFLFNCKFIRIGDSTYLVPSEKIAKTTKDDIWVTSTSPNFQTSHFFRSTYYGPSHSGIEVCLFTKFLISISQIESGKLLMILTFFLAL
jgi:hypothetical protein